jgi:hypothetical protein
VQVAAIDQPAMPRSMSITQTPLITILPGSSPLSISESALGASLKATVFVTGVLIFPAFTKSISTELTALNSCGGKKPELAVRIPGPDMSPTAGEPTG